jgi:nucleoid DNA-binding protein
MIPKKPKEIIKQVSEELDISQTLVDDVVTFYYKSLRKKLSDVEDLRYSATGLGDFLIRNTGVSKAIRKFESMKKGIGDATFSNYHNRKLIEGRLTKLYKINDKIEEFMEKKRSFKEMKYGKQAKRNLEEPEANS